MKIFIALIPLFFVLANYKTNMYSISKNITIYKNININNELSIANTKMSKCIIYSNIVTKETWYITETENTTNGKYFEMYEHIDANGFVNVEHIHPYQSEYILVLNGRIKIYVNNNEYIMNKGDEISLPPGILHKIDNRDYNGETLLLVQYMPALNNRIYLFKRLSELAQEGKLDDTGLPTVSFFRFRIPNLFIISKIFEYIPGMYKLWWLPDIFQDIIFWVASYSASVLY